MPESLLECNFETAIFPCNELLQGVITEDGLCFTFNALTYENMFYNGSNELISMNSSHTFMAHWTEEDGYGSIGDFLSEAHPYPYRVFSAGSNEGFAVLLTVRKADVDYLCRGPVEGFKVIIHSPHELPDVNAKHFRIPANEDVRMSIKQNIMITSKSLKDYTPERRQCYFNSERKLRYMQTYTQQNCYLECIANYSLENCGCVKFSMPRDDNTPICGVVKIICYTHIENALWEDAGTCNCLPACTSVSYDVEISQGKYELDEYLHALKMSHFCRSKGYSCPICPFSSKKINLYHPNDQN